mmetsp:Transcript_71813/g.169055  ORF Transcript_71813/g.169055 Transcript_71813/m.169055 type:complete len:84 (-) Transcript_71813:114-365(-)
MGRFKDVPGLCLSSKCELKSPWSSVGRIVFSRNLYGSASGSALSIDFGGTPRQDSIQHIARLGSSVTHVPTPLQVQGGRPPFW